MRCPSCAAPNPDEMRYCGQCGRSLRPQKQAPLQHSTQLSMSRERRNVSIVFIDLSGFTSLTHGFDPEKLRDLADEILTIVAGIIEDYDGYVDAFQGDGLIALFGAPHSHPDDAYRAVEAAAAGLEAIETIGKSKGYRLKGRAGVNTGIVIAGAVGSGRVREYTVMGSAVNLAARLESAAAPGEVWVGAETFEATRHRASYETVTSISLAGFPDVSSAHKLVSIDTSSTSDPYAHLIFTGRQAELAQLTTAFETSSQDARARTLWLIGEAGSGKTRLALHFSEQLRQQMDARTLWIDEQFLDSEAMWQQLAEQVFGLPPETVEKKGDSPGDTRAAWQKQVTEHVNLLLPNEPRWQGYILRSLSLAPAQTWQRLERRGIDRTFLAWRDLLRACVLQHWNTTAQATVLVVEHSSQGSTFGQFLDLFQDGELPLLILRTSRGRDVPASAATVLLKPLSLEESLKLVEQIANPILRIATESLVFQVGGIPANILELGRALSITQQGSFSGSLASLLQARLDMLSPAARQLLAGAALSGDKSWESLMLELAARDDHSSLDELVRDNLLIKDPKSSIPGETEYHFQSELLRRAVLRMIPFTDRPLLHLRIASWLEKHAPLTLSELIGYHFKEGRSHEAAYPHYLAAADLAANEGKALTEAAEDSTKPPGEASERAYALYNILLTLELPRHLLAEGALTFAQTALSYCDQETALEQLNAADGWIELCDPELRKSLRDIHSQLYADLKPNLLETCEG